ncbi:MAG: fatty acid hydroxylase [Chitinophagaceae bacterium]|jgi:sterol desaturase/sphingolipid hydroxylase (fatty acid hydroxylase superfamily)|nr:fatty acid hydroxylase [Chitinophagaceae bacterium]
MPEFPNILVSAVPAFILLIVVEVIYAVRSQRELYEVKDASTSISLGLGNLFIGIATKSFILIFFIFIYEHRLFTIPHTAWWAWGLIFFADDFSYYWFHRVSHHVRWFWASHIVHHSSEKYNLAAALRQTWTGNLAGSFVFWSWMPLVGFHPAMIMLMQSVSLLYQFWIHTEAINKCPRWFEYVFNTPSHHRVHHGSDIEYLDRNHAGILIIWDRMFGSFQPEMHTPKYGLTKNVNTFNPVKVAFFEWVNIARDLKRSDSFFTAFKYLINPPGWSHDGSSKTTKELRKEARSPIEHTPR